MKVLTGSDIVLVFNILTILANICNCHVWPSNVRRCARNETNLNKCLMQSAKASMSLIAKGNKELGIRSLDPLRVGNMSLSNEGPPVICNFQIMNGVLEGLSKMVIQNISYNPKKHEMMIEGLHKKLKLSGAYDSIGNIYSLNYKSKGKFAFENKNVQVFHVVKLEPSRKRDFMDMDLFFSVRNIGRTRMSFKDKILPAPAREALSKMVNDNWLEVTGAMIPSFESAVSEVLNKALSPMFRRFPMSTIFPNKV